MATPPTTLGSRLRELREARGWTRRQLAILGDCTEQSIFQLEKNQRDPSLGLLRRLAKALDVPPSELLPDEAA